MEKYLETLNKALSNIKIADHILYISYPLIKEKRLLLKALEEIYHSIINIINSILQYDFIYKRIKLEKEATTNFNIFVEKCYKRYNMTEEELKTILEIISIVQKHKTSSMEFLREENIIIMSDNLATTPINFDKLKNYLNLSKILFRKTSFVLKTL